MSGPYITSISVVDNLILCILNQRHKRINNFPLTVDFKVREGDNFVGDVDNNKKRKEMSRKNDKQRLVVLDKESGEEIDGGKLIYFPKRVKIREAWFMGFTLGFEMLAKKKLSGESMRVLMFLLSRMDYENHILQRQKQVAEALDMHKTSVSRAVKELRENGILLPKEEGGWTLSYDVGWRGRVSNLREAQARDFSEAIASGEIQVRPVAA